LADNLRVLDLKNHVLGHLDFMRERLVFLVFARLQLLVEIFLDLRLLGLDFQIALLAVGFDLPHARLRGLERALRGGGPGV